MSVAAIEEEYEVVSSNPRIQAAYVECRQNGCTHKLAEMLAFQKPPRANDDTTWLASQSDSIGGANLDNAPEIVQKAYTEPAKRAGVSINGSVYVPGLASFPGDPSAWVKNLSEVKARVEEKGMSCQGAVNVKARNDTPPPPDIDIAPELVVERAVEMMEANPDLKMGEDLLNTARDDIKPHWAK